MTLDWFPSHDDSFSFFIQFKAAAKECFRYLPSVSLSLYLSLSVWGLAHRQKQGTMCRQRIFKLFISWDSLTMLNSLSSLLLALLSVSVSLYAHSCVCLCMVTSAGYSLHSSAGASQLSDLLPLFLPALIPAHINFEALEIWQIVSQQPRWHT